MPNGKSTQPLQPVTVDGTAFVLANGMPFVPVGFNYDHDEHYRLLEDYWVDEWQKVETDFVAMQRWGATVVRIHLQVGAFLSSASTCHANALIQLDRLLSLAVQCQLRIHLVGLGCYHRTAVPTWYDVLPEQQRWATQAFFWHTLAQRYRGHPAIFCFDLMNEPVVPGRKRHQKGWLGPEFHGKSFVQFISLDGTQAPRIDIAVRWTRLLVDTIRQADPQRMITIGLVDWSLPGIEPQRSGFDPAVIAPLLDFVCAHVYPSHGKVDTAVRTVRQFCLGKPLLLDETFPLRCPVEEIDAFLSAVQPLIAGFLGFYTDQVSPPTTQHHHERNALMHAWLAVFHQQAQQYARPVPVNACSVSE